MWEDWGSLQHDKELIISWFFAPYCSHPDPFRWTWFVPRGPDSYCGALICSSGPWSVLRGPDSHCGPHPTGRGFVLQSSNASRGALIRSAGPWNLIENRPQLGAQAGPGGPASVLGKQICCPRVIGLCGEWPECPPGTTLPPHQPTLLFSLHSVIYRLANGFCRAPSAADLWPLPSSFLTSHGARFQCGPEWRGDGCVRPTWRWLCMYIIIVPRRDRARRGPLTDNAPCWTRHNMAVWVQVHWYSDER